MRSSLPEGDSRSGFPPAGLPLFPVPTRAQYRWYFPADYSACVRQSLRDMAHSRLTARRQPPRIVIPSDLCWQFHGGDRADWSTGVLRGRTCQTCRTSRTERLVCSVPLDNNKTGSYGSRSKPRKLVKRKLPYACCAPAQRYARYSSGVIPSLARFPVGGMIVR